MKARQLVLSLLIIFSGNSPAFAKSIKIAFWNVENLFDLKNDPNTNDDEFALGGRKNVTENIYNLKLENLTEIINVMNPDVLGLCEIENRFVLEELNQAVKRDYSIIHYDSPDNRGIDVALLYDSKLLEITESKVLTVILPTKIPTRDILYVKAKFSKIELNLFVNHWPSKYGGAEKSIPLRAAAAKTLRKKVNSILSKNPKAEIIIMGDLNDEPIDPSITIHLGASMQKKKMVNHESILWNVMQPWHRNPEGSTYKYDGIDMVYDHLIVSEGLIDNIGLKLVPNSVGVFSGKKYRQHGGKYDGYPFRFWAGSRVLGGYSDHMPIYLKIESE